MVDRTLYRPREIIQFCTLALESARDSQTTIPLRRTAVRDAEYHYSRERAKDIAAEYRFQYPGLISLFEAFRGKDLIFSRDDIELLCLELITRDLPARGADGWLDACTPESLVEILWNVGFLGAGTGQNAKARHIRAASFLGPHQASEPTVIAAQRFRIHPMFWFYLGNQAPPAQQIPHV
jgi:hypothetical protein